MGFFLCHWWSSLQINQGKKREELELFLLYVHLWMDIMQTNKEMQSILYLRIIQVGQTLRDQLLGNCLALEFAQIPVFPEFLCFI